MDKGNLLIRFTLNSPLGVTSLTVLIVSSSLPVVRSSGAENSGR